MTPVELVRELTDMAVRLTWIDWLELGGSLGRGAGDALSDVDAAVGLDEDDAPEDALERIRGEVAAFGPVAASQVDAWPGGHHLSVVYADGMELSLVLVPAGFRKGLPPQARALVDRSGRLARSMPEEYWDADAETRRAWIHVAWTSAADAARHTARGHAWRALRSIAESRDHALQLWAARLGLTYPRFGAVTLENAGVEPPEGIEGTHPASLRREELAAAVLALTGVLRQVTTDDGLPLAAALEARITRLLELPAADRAAVPGG